jgi:hypothetical protein
MEKLVKEKLNEVDYNYRSRKNVEKEHIIAQIKKRCEDIIAGAEEYFQSLEDEGMDTDELDSDEVENYVSNESASNLAHQILDIINTK